MTTQLHKPFLALLFLISVSFCAFSQESEAEIKEKATQLFEDEKFVEATPLYLRLIALNPRSTDYNFRYGTCLLFNSYKKQDAFKYLNYAVTDAAIDVQAFYFLGKAYHLNYQFNEAIKNYELYRQKSNGKPKASFQIDRQIEMCQNGKRLLTTITDLIVLEKKEIEIANFFRLYDLRNIGGDILVAADFQTKIDKKKNHTPLIHFPARTTSVFYASYGDVDTGQKDIYTRKKLPDGTWSLPQLVPGNVNSLFDEDFPYLHPDGQYLYFSSKGHSSMGGFDIFRSKFDAENNTFGIPENMDFAISSPDNDLFYVADSIEQNAYFASSRQSTNGKMYVYKVRVERVPIQLAVVKGDFASTINPANKKISVTVTDFASGEKIGVFNSTEKGKYLITFPKGGKYQYEMKVEGSTVIHKSVVSIPFLKEFKPLKQKIREELDGANEIVKITDLFNEEVEDPQSVIAEVIKMRSELNVNVQSFDLKELEAKKANQQILADLGLANAGPAEIVAKFDQLASNQKSVLQAKENLRNGALTSALKALEEAEILQKDAKTYVATATSATTDEKKLADIRKAQTKMTEANSKKEFARELIQFSDSVAQLIPSEQEKSTELKQLSEEVRTAVANENFTQLKEIVSLKATTIKSSQTSATNNPIDALLAAKSELQKQTKQLEKQIANYTESEKSLSNEINGLQSELTAAKKKDQPAIQSKLDAKTAEKDAVVQEKSRLDKKMSVASKEEKAINDRISFVQSISQTTSDSKTIAPNEVQAKLDEVDTKNNRTLENYINQQAIDLEKKTDNSIANNGNSNTSDAAFVALKTDFSKQQNAVDSQSDLTPEDKITAKSKNEQDYIAQLDKQLNAIDQALISQPNDAALQAKKTTLTEEKTSTQKSLATHEAELKTLQSQPVIVNQTTEQTLADLVPDYKEQQSKAKSSDSKKQLENMNAIDQQVLSKVDSKLLELEKELNTNPTDSKKIADKKALENLKVATVNQIDTRNTAIARLTGTSNEATESTNASKELAKINPNYEKQQTEALQLTDQSAQIQRAISIDEALIDQINKEINSTETELSKNQNSSSLKSILAALNDLKSTTESKITNRKNQLSSLQSTASVAGITAESELKSIAPNYEEQQLATQKAATRTEQLKRANAVDQVLIAKVNSALKVTENGLIANPSDANLIAKKEALTQLKAKTESQIAQRDAELKEPIVGSSTEVITPESELAKLIPNYNEQQTAAQKTSDKELQLKQANAVDETLISKINTALADTEIELQKSPSDAAILARKTALSQLKTTTENQIAQRNSEISRLQTPVSESITAETQLAKLAPNYEEQQKSALASGDPIQQLKASNSIDETLLKQIEKEQQTVNEQLVNTPNNTDLTTKKAALEELKTKTELKIKERNTQINTLQTSNSNSTASTSNPIEEKVRPNFSENVQKIQTSTKTEEEKEVALLKENQAYLVDLEKAIVKSDGALSKNPTDEKLVAENFQLKTEQALQEAKVFEKRGELIAKEQSKLNVSAVENKVDSKFKPVTEAEMSSLSAEQKQDKIKEEEKFQAKLDEVKIANDKKNTASFDAKLAAENKIIETSKENSIARVELLKSNSNNSNTLNSTNAIELENQTKAAISADLGVKESFIMTQRPETKEMAQEQLKELNQYANSLQKTIGDLNQQESKNVAAIDLKNNQLTVVKKRIATIEFEIEQLNKLTVSSPTLEFNPSEEDSQLKSLKSEEKELTLKLETSQTASERKTIQKELTANKEKQREVEIATNQKTASVLAQRREVASSNLKQQDPSSNLVQQVIERSTTKTDEKQEFEESKSQLLISKIQNEQNAISLLNTTQDVLNIQKEEKKTGLQIATLDQLKSNKRRYVIEIGEIAQELKRLPVNKDTEAKRSQLLATQSEMQIAVNDLDRMILKEEQRELAQIDLIKTNTAAVTDVEERKIVTSDVYKELTIDKEAYQVVVNQQKEIEKEVVQKKNEIAQTTNSVIKEQKKDELKVLLSDSENLNQEKSRISETIENKAKSNNFDPKQVNNLLVRGVAPREPIAEPVANGGIILENETLSINEMPEGLFYTVQIGAFSQEVKPLQFNRFKPLTAQKQASGQVRYSTGFYNSVDEARPKKAEVITGGIKDAFITAYFNGERITIEEADKISKKKRETELTSTATNSGGVGTVKYVAFESEENLPERFVQLVSQQKFESYPKTIVSNLHGISNFYFDSIDHQIKSQFYLNLTALPDVQASAFVFDTVEVNRLEQQSIAKGTSLVSIQFKGTELTGELSNWLLRLSIPYCGIPTKDGVRLLFPVVENDQKQQLLVDLKQFKYTDYTEIQNR